MMLLCHLSVDEHEHLLLRGNSSTTENDRESVLRVEAKSVARKLTVLTHAGGKTDQQHPTTTHLTPHYCRDTDTINGRREGVGGKQR